MGDVQARSAAKIDERRSFVIVSNRLPITVSKNSGKLTYTHSSGGLATAMSSLSIDEAKRVWIGWPGISSEELSQSDLAKVTIKLREYGCIPVFLTKKQIQLFYDHYSNETVWPLFHYFQTHVEYDEKAWKCYQEVNGLFCKTVAKYANPNAQIWIHDYHLLLLPTLIRFRLPDTAIGFFLHIPFPSSEIFRVLPNRREILEGMLGADLVGFHIYDYARHFLSSVLRTLGLNSDHGAIVLGTRNVRVDAFPIGIDYDKFSKAASTSSTTSRVKALLDHYENKKIILSDDRLDYSKGIPERLDAFRIFLQMYPQYHKKVVLVVVAVPSRVEVPAYQDLRRSVEESISHINGTFGTVDWTPITYQFQNLPFDELIALYASASIALVTPLRDGMNLVAKEYVASRTKHTGVLILSELTGAVNELPEALHVNPNNPREVAAVIKNALTMPLREQQRRMSAMQKRLSRYTVQRWAEDFIEELASARAARASTTAKRITSSHVKKLSAQFQKAEQRALFLDYDGTLRTFVSSPDPGRAKPAKELLRMLGLLTKNTATQIFLVSGRTREALDSWFRDLPVTLVAEHGLWVKQGGEWFQADVSFHEYRQSVLDVLERYAERTAGATVETKSHSLVWHYRNVTPELAFIRNDSLTYELHTILKNSDIAVFHGHKIIEVKPKGVHKGTVIDDFLASTPYDFVLAIGDDQTDEDMFEVLPHYAHSVKVGPGETKAKLRVSSVADVHTLLQSLIS
jgi:trehalose 6-phosphate synthase/phosphatase